MLSMNHHRYAKASHRLANLPSLTTLACLITNVIIGTHHKAQAFSNHQQPRFATLALPSNIHTKLHMMSNILESPSAERNKIPIYNTIISPILLPTLLQHNSNSLKVLEVAAGCGVHTTHFASSILSSHPNIELEWIPSDPDEEARISIDERVIQSGLTRVVQNANGWVLGNMRGGTACNDGIRDKEGDGGASSARNKAQEVLDYSSYKDGYFDLVLCINMIHIAPWEATLGLMECAGQVLRSGGMLMCYGPYKVNGTAVESNLKFDASLKSKDPSWGVRDIAEVTKVANANGLEFVQSIEMPANNLSVLFTKK